MSAADPEEIVYEETNGNLTTSTDTSNFNHLRERNVVMVLHIDNDLDSEVTVELFGTNTDDEGTWDDELSLGSATVAAGGSGKITLVDEPWTVFRVKNTPTTDPTSGDIRVYKMAAFN